MIVADWKVSQGSNNVKRKALNSRSVKVAEATTATEESAAAGAEDTTTDAPAEPAAAGAGEETTEVHLQLAENHPTMPTTATQNATVPDPTHATIESDQEDDEDSETTESENIQDENRPRPDMRQEAHGLKWYDESNRLRRGRSINGDVAPRQWYVKDAIGDKLSPIHNKDKVMTMSRLDFFLLMFPPNHLNEIVRLTNVQLRLIPNQQSRKEMTKGELIKFIGICILVTKFEFKNRADLWQTKRRSKFREAPSFGSKTGMSRDRFKLLFTNIRWSKQPRTRPEAMAHEAYRWMLVDDFVKAFNDHRAATFSPSEELCVDESMVRWYGLGGDWINIGLPHYVAIDRKPENGAEIQDSCDGKSGVMLRLKVVKVQPNDDDDNDDEPDLNHGTMVLKELVEPWLHTDRIVCADSYFSSVQTAIEMLRLGTRFIGVVKTATKKYPMRYLTSLELENRGDLRGLVAEDENGKPELLAFVWMDRDRRYFISTTSSLERGTPAIRTRWRQVEDVATNEEPERVELIIPQPKATEIYYNTCAGVDMHNRSRQDNLKLERKLETKNWSVRLNLSILGIIIVDAWKVYKGTLGENTEDEQDFYENLAEEMIDNDFERVYTRRNRGSPSATSPSNLVSRDGRVRSGTSAHLTPTKKRRKRKVPGGGFIETNYRQQMRCKVCGKKTIHLCSQCQDENEKDFYLCDTKKGDTCFADHVNEYHGTL